MNDYFVHEQDFKVSAWIEIYLFAVGVLRDIVLIHLWFSLIILVYVICHLPPVSFYIPISNI